MGDVIIPRADAFPVTTFLKSGTKDKDKSSSLEKGGY